MARHTQRPFRLSIKRIFLFYTRFRRIVILSCILCSFSAALLLLFQNFHQTCSEPTQQQFQAQSKPVYYNSRLFEGDNIKPALAKVLQRHAERTKEILDGASLGKDYILFRTTREGLGNRLLSLTSAFLVALLAQRPFIIDWHVMADPYAMPHLFHPRTPRMYLTVEEALQRSPRDSPLWANVSRMTKPVWRTLGCSGNYSAQLPAHTLVYIDQYFAPLLFHSPYRDTLEEWFEPFQCFRTLFHVLLRLTPQLDAEFQAMRNSLLAKSDLKIGMQIRMREGKYNSMDQAKVYLQCAKMLASRRRLEHNVSYFLATDDDGARALAMKAFGNQLKFVEIPYSRKSVRSIQGAVLDIFLLGECDELLVSGYSTFGAVSAARTGLLPHLVTRDLMCVQLLHSEPPFHHMKQYVRNPYAGCLKSDPLDDMINRLVKHP
mmetsp:Transcript_8318/g.13546  ORF Transcript_8318/g.13546 Transcript_8318/m.13546 type:complete len:433 (-) Transcript_8318:137-1435(-)